jgi:uncharacterized integral membrane protein (TIGR00697 family)
MNELLLILTAIISCGFVLVGWKLGKERLYSVIIVFLILITAFGGKIVEFFGHATNTGNIFYASVFLATYFLIERYGKKEGVYSIWVGLIVVIFFAVLTHLTVALVGADATSPLNTALLTAFNPILRVALASLAAYAVSQTINVYIYLYLKERMRGKYMWLRANIANVVAQIMDSVVFFSIAFIGVVSPDGIWGIIVTGLVIKIVFVAVTSPLLYLNTIEESEDADGNSLITMRHTPRFFRS